MKIIFLTAIGSMSSLISSSQINTGYIVMLFLHTYLQERVIIHCLDRKVNSAKFDISDVIEANTELGRFTISGSMGHLYKLNFGNVGMPPECSCPDFTEWNIPCKHFFAIFRLFPQWRWNKLPDHYLNGPYMSSDQTTINTFFDTCNSHYSCSSEQTTFHDDIPSQMDNIPKKVY